MRKIVFMGIFVLSSFGANCADFSETSIQYLGGDAYTLGPTQRNFFTLESFNAHFLGDVFFFMDIQRPFNTDTSLYAEAVANFSTKKIALRNEPISSFLTDVSLALSLEFNPVGARLVGLTFDLAVPYFQVFRLTPFFRNQKGIDGESFQLTWVWSMPISIGSTGWLFEGFLDYATGESQLANTLLAQPRMLFDLGRVVWNRENHLWLGIEYLIWDNKFGIDGVTESVVQYMVKWVL